MPRDVIPLYRLPATGGWVQRRIEMFSNRRRGFQSSVDYCESAVVVTLNVHVHVRIVILEHDMDVQYDGTSVRL